MNKPFAAVLLAIFLAAPIGVKGQTFTTGALNLDGSNILSVGPVLYAYNLDYDGAAATTTLNGVTFVGVNTNAPGFTSPDFSISGSPGYDGTLNKDGSGTPLTPADALYELQKNGAYYSLTLTLQNLTPGQTYAAQLAITEQTSDNRQQSYTDGAVTSAIVYAHDGPMFITDTFTATGTTETLQANYTSGAGAQLAGFVVETETVPEPGTWAMMGLSLALLVFVAARRSAVATR